MDNKNRRSSILKRQMTADISSVSPTASFSKPKNRRRISFSEKKSIKEFRDGKNIATIWDSSYEISAESRKLSTIENSNNELIFNKLVNFDGNLSQPSPAFLTSMTIQEDEVELMKQKPSSNLTLRDLKLLSEHDSSEVGEIDMSIEDNINLNIPKNVSSENDDRKNNFDFSKNIPVNKIISMQLSKISECELSDSKIQVDKKPTRTAYSFSQINSANKTLIPLPTNFKMQRSLKAINNDVEVDKENILCPIDKYQQNHNQRKDHVHVNVTEPSKDNETIFTNSINDEEITTASHPMNHDPKNMQETIVCDTSIIVNENIMPSKYKKQRNRFEKKENTFPKNKRETIVFDCSIVEENTTKSFPKKIPVHRFEENDEHLQDISINETTNDAPKPKDIKSIVSFQYDNFPLKKKDETLLFDMSIAEDIKSTKIQSSLIQRKDKTSMKDKRSTILFNNSIFDNANTETFQNEFCRTQAEEKFCDSKAKQKSIIFENDLVRDESHGFINESQLDSGGKENMVLSKDEEKTILINNENTSISQLQSSMNLIQSKDTTPLKKKRETIVFDTSIIEDVHTKFPRAEFPLQKCSTDKQKPNIFENGAFVSKNIVTSPLPFSRDFNLHNKRETILFDNSILEDRKIDAVKNTGTIDCNQKKNIILSGDSKVLDTIIIENENAGTSKNDLSLNCIMQQSVIFSDDSIVSDKTTIDRLKKNEIRAKNKKVIVREEDNDSTHIISNAEANYKNFGIDLGREILDSNEEETANDFTHIFNTKKFSNIRNSLSLKNKRNVSKTVAESNIKDSSEIEKTFSKTMDIEYQGSFIDRLNSYESNEEIGSHMIRNSQILPANQSLQNISRNSHMFEIPKIDTNIDKSLDCSMDLHTDEFLNLMNIKSSNTILFTHMDKSDISSCTDNFSVKKMINNNVNETVGNQIDLSLTKIVCKNSELEQQNCYSFEEDDTTNFFQPLRKQASLSETNLSIKIPFSKIEDVKSSNDHVITENCNNYQSNFSTLYDKESHNMEIHENNFDACVIENQILSGIVVKNEEIHESVLDREIKEKSLKTMNLKSFCYEGNANSDNKKFLDLSKISNKNKFESSTIENTFNLEKTFDASDDIDKTEFSLIASMDDSVEEKEIQKPKSESNNLKSSNSKMNWRNSICSRCRTCRWSVDTTDLRLFRLQEMPSKYENLKWEILEEYESCPTIFQVCREYEHSKNENTTIFKNSEISIVESIIPDLKFQLDTHKQEYGRNRRCDENLMQVLFPFAVPFHKLLENTFQNNKFPWRLNYLLLDHDIIKLTHRTVKTFNLIFKLQSQNLSAYNVKFEKIIIQDNHFYKNRSIIDNIIYREITKRLPADLTCIYPTSENFWKCLNDINCICSNILEEAKNLLVAMHVGGSVFECDNNNCIFIKKICRTEAYNKITKVKEFHIKLRYIDHLNFHDIVLPSKSEFNECAEILPKGIDFLNDFLQNPLKFLK